MIWQRQYYCLVLILWLTSAAPGQAVDSPTSAKAAPTLANIAVLNFDNLGQGNPEWDWLGKGLADLTIGDLTNQGFKVVSREQMQEMIRELTLNKRQLDPRSVAQVLKAVRCVHGTYRVADGKAQLHASILEVATGKQLHTATVEGSSANLLILQKKLSAELADVFLESKPGTIDAAKLPKWTESLKASQLLYQGIDLFDRGEYLSAWGLFRRALHLDANYADALYWSGRMMYYALEYHQARVVLERFCRQHPKHQRVGDAVLEIINAVQLTAVDAEEVLRALDFAASLAPLAEVHNQFGPGHSSTVGLYAAALAAQILRPLGRYRDSFERFGQQLQKIPVDHSLPLVEWGKNVPSRAEKQLIPFNHLLYWLMWHEMFALRVWHLKASGELLPMPPMLRSLMPLSSLAPASLHPRDLNSRYTLFPYPTISGAIHVGGDHPLRQEFVLLTPERSVWEGDFTKDPLRPPMDGTYTRYFHTDPRHYLKGVEVEIRFLAEAGTSYEVCLEGDVFKTYVLPFSPGKFRLRCELTSICHLSR